MTSAIYTGALLYQLSYEVSNKCEQHTGITEAMGSNPIVALKFF